MKYLLILALGVCSTFIVVAYLFFSQDHLYIGDTIHFKSDKGGFEYVAMPSKGRDYEAMMRNFNAFKEKKELGDDVSVFRTTRRNYFNVRKWCHYKNMPEWRHPFKSL